MGGRRDWRKEGRKGKGGREEERGKGGLAPRSYGGIDAPVRSTALQTAC